jgi:prophage maintenance system killer protein
LSPGSSVGVTAGAARPGSVAKRLALLATVVFLRIDGYTLDLTDDEAFYLTMSVAAGQLDAPAIEKQLRLAQASPGSSVS